MPWYYAENGQQQGPLTDEQFQSLAQAGTIRAETLVWRDGMAEWQPYQRVVPSSGTPPAATPGGVVCSECGNSFAPDQVIRIGERNVCAACKPVFVQRMTEGAAPGAVSGLHVSEQQVLEREYRIDIGTALERAWKLFSANAGSIIGATVVAGLLFIVGWGISTAISLVIPFANMLLQSLYVGPLSAGLLWFFLRLSRNEPATISDVFAGYSQRFVPLLLASLTQGLITIVCLLPVAILGGVVGLSANAITRGQFSTGLGVGVIGALVVTGLLGFAAIVYITMLWTYSFLLIMDKRMKFWPAMQLSRKQVSRRWGMTFLFYLVAGILSSAGVIACLVGLLVTVPLAFCMNIYLYEDNFRDLQPATT